MFISARTWASVTPGLRRPIVCNCIQPRCPVAGSLPSASRAEVIQKLGEGVAIGKLKAAGITPTMVNWSSKSLTVWPRMVGELLKSETQNSRLITTLRLPAFSSSRVKARPIAGWMPRNMEEVPRDGDSGDHSSATVGIGRGVQLMVGGQRLEAVISGAPIEEIRI